MSALTVRELTARIRASHYRTTFRELDIGDVDVECCVICVDDGWPCDATALADAVDPE